LLLGSSWALFLGGMFSQGIIAAPLSDRILKAGAVGYGWLNFGWALGACTSAFYTPRLIRGHGHRRAIGVATALLGLSLIALPFAGYHVSGAVHLTRTYVVSLALLAAVLIYFLMGCCRALGGVAITSTVMDQVPKHFMGRVQNTVYFSGTLLQLALSFAVGSVAHSRGLAEAFAIVGLVYLLACVAGIWPVKAAPEPVEEAALSH
jgi:MFS family permease